MGDHRLGTDVSDFQPTNSWDRMVSGGVAYAWVKQNQGSFTCKSAVTHRKEADARGVKVGGYSWAVFNSPARSSAETFVSLLHQGPSTLPPVLDVEDVYPSGQPTGSSPAQRADWIAQFQGIVETEMGVVPVLYTGGWYWKPYVQTRPEQARWPLWLAAYPGGTNLPDHMPTPVAPWDHVTVWQYAGDVPYFGMSSTDLNVTPADSLAALAGGKPQPQQPAPQPVQQGGLSMADAASLSAQITQLNTDIEGRFNQFRVEVAGEIVDASNSTKQFLTAVDTSVANDAKNGMISFIVAYLNQQLPKLASSAQVDLLAHAASLTALSAAGVKPGEAVPAK